MGHIESYEDDYRDNKYDIVRLLRIPIEFEDILDNHTLNKLTNLEKFIVDYKGEYGKLSSIKLLVKDYYNIFTKSVSSIDKVDFETLEIIKDDFNKWISWIEKNHISTDEGGNLIYEEYTLEEMIKSNLINK